MVLASLLTRGGRRRALSVFLLAVAAALISLSGAQSSVKAPGSGWFSGNPPLGPPNLTSLVSVGGATYAGGGSGTLLKSLDGGSTWSGITTGIRDPITILAPAVPERRTGDGTRLRRCDELRGRR